ITELVQEGVENLIMEEDKKGTWKAEYAKSSRSTCKSCGSKIEKGKVRVGEASYFDDHLSYKWNHEDCIYWSKISKDKITGLDELEEDDNKRIAAKIK
ncbi:MAG: hypothetical protein KGD64_03870, partial [Candidatus Heimdallarchaeota archaeon]|nr:hypothetical protein [Candidatus Heimdallarchaeota archaeon]